MYTICIVTCIQGIIKSGCNSNNTTVHLGVDESAVLQQLHASSQTKWEGVAMSGPNKAQELLRPVHRAPTVNNIFLKHLHDVSLKHDEKSLYLTTFNNSIIMASQYSRKIWQCYDIDHNAHYSGYINTKHTDFTNRVQTHTQQTGCHDRTMQKKDKEMKDMKLSID